MNLTTPTFPYQEVDGILSDSMLASTKFAPQTTSFIPYGQSLGYKRPYQRGDFDFAMITYGSNV